MTHVTQFKSKQMLMLYVYNSDTHYSGIYQIEIILAMLTDQKQQRFNLV